MISKFLNFKKNPTEICQTATGLSGILRYWVKYSITPPPLGFYAPSENLDGKYGSAVGRGDTIKTQGQNSDTLM